MRELAPNVHVVFTPELGCDLASFGWLYERLPEWYRQRYGRVITMNGGTKGPFWFPEYHARRTNHQTTTNTTWLDVVSLPHLALPREDWSVVAGRPVVYVANGEDPSIVKKFPWLLQRVILVVTLSKEVALHGQSYFTSLSPLGAWVLLGRVWSERPRDKHACIYTHEIRAATRMMNKGFVYAAMGQQLRTDKHARLVPRINPYVSEDPEGKMSVFIKHGGVHWPAARREDLQNEQLTGEVRIRRRWRQATGKLDPKEAAAEALGAAVFDSFLALCPPMDDAKTRELFGNIHG